MGALASRAPLLPRDSRGTGFTLIEVLLVIAIAGITLGLLSLRAMPGERQALQAEAQRIALLWQLAGDEAILRNRPILFEADANQYRFLVRNQGRWSPLAGDELLRARNFAHAPLTLRMTPADGNAPMPVRIVFGRQPVGKPFVLSLSSGEASVGIRADGLGQYQVE